MVLKLAGKVNKNGWRKQLTVDFSSKTIKTGGFQFRAADVGDLTAKQYKEMIDFFIDQGFKKTEV